MATTIAQIGGFALWDILQLAQTSRMSIKLSVDSPHGTGAMFFEGGNLRHAIAGDKTGDAAVDVILEWREGSVSSSQLPADCPQTVKNSSIVALLMDRARMKDEQDRENERRGRKTGQTQEAPPKKEDTAMDLKAVKVILEEIDEALMGGCLGVDIISKASGMSIAGINSAPRVCALFNRMSDQLQNALASSKDSPAKSLKKFIVEGDNGLYIFVVEVDARHRWTMLIDGSQTPLGMVFSVIIPDILPRLEESLKHYTNPM